MCMGDDDDGPLSSRGWGWVGVGMVMLEQTAGRGTIGWV